MLAQVTTTAPTPWTWTALLMPSLPWWEMALRGILVYIFLIILMRLSGRRQVGMLTPFDFILLLILSNAVQNSMNGGDNSLGGGLIIATTLILLNWGVSWLSRRSKFLEGLIVGRPIFLIQEGKIQEKVLVAEKITHHELMASLRAAGCANIAHVRHAILETNGSITVIQHDSA